VSKMPGVRLVPLKRHHDARGWLCEMYRHEWARDVDGRQVNVMRSVAGSLRGSHVHGKHLDYFYVPIGRALAGLKDVRKQSPTFDTSEMIELDERHALIVPPGVVHGLYFTEESLLVTVESDYYNPGEEFRVKWDEPALEMEWPCEDPILSDADKDAPPFNEMIRRLEPYQDKMPL